jgi:hypothetical protein
MAWSPFVLGSRGPNLAPKSRRGAIPSKQSDDQKECPDSEISDADSITAALVAEERSDQTAPPENLSQSREEAIGAASTSALSSCRNTNFYVAGEWGATLRRDPTGWAGPLKKWKNWKNGKTRDR